jgi:two-component system cell cycle sensor histidine kinase/response regulator CckA
VSGITVASRRRVLTSRIMTFDPSLPPPTVLIVDDDAVVRRVVQGHLSAAGYRIFEAEDGHEALEVLERLGSVDLVITDIVMPRMDGPTFVEEVLRRRPSQPVLLISAYPAERAGPSGRLSHPFLPKPFTRDELYAKITEAGRAGVSGPT